MTDTEPSGQAPTLPAEPDKGRLLYEYRGPRAHPIVYAGLIVFAFVFVTGSIENLLRGSQTTVYVAYAAPFVAVLLIYILLAPATVRIYSEGIEPGRPFLLSWHRPFVRWDDLEAVYPSYYDVTGAFVSPFASSDGKVTQMGLGLEHPGGRVETVKFTPMRFVAWRPGSAGYKGAIQAVRHAFAEKGRSLVAQATTFDAQERQAMEAEARAPFLPFFAIVALFASAAPILFLLVWYTPLPIWAALAIALLPPLGVSTTSYLRSRRRNAILNRLSKADEFRRAADPGTTSAGVEQAAQHGAEAA